MIGIVLGLALLVSLPAGVLEKNLKGAWGGPWQAAGGAVVVVVVAWIVGLFLVRTVGMASVGYTLGALIASVLCLVTGQAAFAPAYACHALAGVLIGNGQRIRLRAEGG